eukprot:gene9317-11961_t
MNPIFSALPTTIFETMSRLAREHQAVNLGQGFPDDPGPEDVRRKAAQAVIDGWNQYPPMMGLPELRQATATHFRHWQGLELDPEAEVMITSGATEAIAGALMAIVSPGDEVVLIEPLYDTYLPVVRLLGAIPKLVRLEPPKWELPRAELAAAFGPKTKAILLNTPMNPFCKVTTATELYSLAHLVALPILIAPCDSTGPVAMDCLAPSSVVTSRPATPCDGITQARAAIPSTSTVQAPHCPRPQPYLGPLSDRSLRSTCSNVALAKVLCGRANGWPLTTTGESEAGACMSRWFFEALRFQLVKCRSEV